MSKTIQEIQDRIDSGRARVYTASEFKELVRSGDAPAVDDVDVVTCGTLGVMSGTAAIFNIPIAGNRAFSRAASVTINGVPGTIGPCPNESLGLIDCIVNGTAHRDKDYGGGHLFRDLVAGEAVHVVVTADDGRVFERDITLAEIPFARIIIIRGAFKNYHCFTNGWDDEYETIFSGPIPFKGGYSEATVSGCGEISPLQNDPNLDYFRPGARVLVNGAPGMVLGEGTRSSPAKPNLSMQADMHLMKAEYMGGFRTSEGPEVLASVAAAIPITGEEAYSHAAILDEETPMPLADAHDRKVFKQGAYAEVWRGTDWDIGVDLDSCLHCGECRADRYCPVGARPSSGIDPSRCVQCGLCTRTCVGGVFSADLGRVDFGDGHVVPVSVRQSSRLKGERLSSLVKEEVERGEWRLWNRPGIQDSFD